MYKERCDEKRDLFLRKIKRVNPKNIVYVDESGIDQCLFREYGRASRGELILSKISGRKFKRTKYCCRNLPRRVGFPMQYNGSTDSSLFEFWFERCLLKEIRRGKFIVLDNAAFHRKARLIELAQKKRCKVIFLPPYSPDLNPIEKKWAFIKQKLRDILHNFDSFDEALWCIFQVE